MTDVQDNSGFKREEKLFEGAFSGNRCNVAHGYGYDIIYANYICSSNVTLRLN